MNPVVAIWIASLVGAALFFAAGLFAARRPKVAPAEPLGTGEVEALQRELVEVRERAAGVPRLMEALDGLKAELAEGASARAEERARLEAPLRAAQARMAELDAQLAAAEARARELAPYAARVVELERALADTSRRLAETSQRLVEESRRLKAAEDEAAQAAGNLAMMKDRLEAEAARALETSPREAHLIEQIHGQEAELEALRDERRSLLERLAEAAELEAEVATLRGAADHATELMLQIRILSERVREVERLSEENLRLRSAEEDNTRLRQRLESISKELGDLRAQAYGKKAPTLKVVPKDERGDKPSLEGIIDGLACAEGVGTVTIADDLGFPLVGRGDHVESLAAFCGLLAEIEGKARSLLPIGGIRRITLETDYNATVSACPLVGRDFRVALATLTVGPAPETRRFTEALEEVAAAIA